jgi:hypothetical protein
MWYNDTQEVVHGKEILKMPAHSYVPGLRIVSSTFNRYATRYTRQLNAGLTTDQITCLNAAIAAIGALIACLGATPKLPNSGL